MRIVIKGGVWKNTEDEILKVAVMKYGKNQWARISSLLTRKTPKQCKARWYEWLDPSIKKTEWSKEEDEKLLHLAKLMPTQWRTIAPIVERTPAQCLERYQILLDEAEREIMNDSSAAAGDSGAAATAVPQLPQKPAFQHGRVRPGDIDPDPETKPARPDPVDMDEDEKEMLSEARARLANTQGKKAKRKARERQLEESRRLASLQKRRELKAAGILSSTHRRLARAGQDDYVNDIPFQRLPAPGFYDTSKELAKKKGQSFSELMLSQVEGKRRAEREADERRKDAKRQKKNAEQRANGTLNAGAIDLSMFEKEFSSKRATLLLPEPQVSETEIAELAKMGATKVPVNSDATDFMSEYSATPRMPMRTPRHAIVDSVRQQARSIVIGKTLQTPLLGEEHVAQLDELPPATTILPTPRVGAGSAGGGSVRETPAHGFPGATPLRDHLGINTPAHLGINSVASTPLDQQSQFSVTTSVLNKNASAATRDSIRLALSSLPAPRNDYQIQIPKDNDNDDNDEDSNGLNIADREDMADIEDAEQREIDRRARDLEEMKSTPVRRNLPRPCVVPKSVFNVIPDAYTDSAEMREALALIDKEMQQLVASDAIEFPQAGVPRGKPQEAISEPYTTPEIEYLRRARIEIDEEFTRIHALSPAEFSASSVSRRAFTSSGCETLIDFKKKCFVDISSADDSTLKALHQSLTEKTKSLSDDSAKLEAKLETKFAGYYARLNKIHAKTAETGAEIDKVGLEYNSILGLYESERAIIPLRIEESEKALAAAVEEEIGLQKQYAALYTKYTELCNAKMASTSQQPN